MTDKANSVAIVSGGLDSTTLVYEMLANGLRPHLLSFNYGQRHKKELLYARAIGKSLGLQHDIIDLRGLTEFLSNSALTSGSDIKEVEGTLRTVKNIEVPDGHYGEESMKQTVVPNRNMIMLSIAAGVAVNNGYLVVATGVHSGDHFIYPDCRPKFIREVARAIEAANEGFAAWDGRGLMSSLHTPFLYRTKEDIALRALELDVPIHLTWSCYKGGEKHCGRCGTCVERLEAIDGAIKRYYEEHGSNRVDLTDYEDTEFWKVATSEARRNSQGA